LYCNSDEIQINSEKKVITLPSVFREFKKDFGSDSEIIEWICTFTTLTKHSTLMEIVRDIQGTIQFNSDPEENMYRFASGTISTPVLVESTRLIDSTSGVHFSTMDPDSFDRLHEHYEMEINKARMHIPDLTVKKDENTVPNHEEDKSHRRKNIVSVIDDVSLGGSFFFNPDSSFLHPLSPGGKGSNSNALDKYKIKESPRRRSGNQATYNTFSTLQLPSSPSSTTSQPTNTKKKRHSIHYESESSTLSSNPPSTEGTSGSTLTYSVAKKNSKDHSLVELPELGLDPQLSNSWPKTESSFLKASANKEGSFFLSKPKETSPTTIDPSSQVEDESKKPKKTGIKSAFKRFVSTKQKGDTEVVDLPEVEID